MKLRRKSIPAHIKRIVLDRQNNHCACGCKTLVGTHAALSQSHPVEYDHRPALSARDIRKDGTDYIPAQLDPAYLFALTPDCHAKRTFHPRSKATSLGSDLHAAAKLKRLRGETGRRAGKKMPSRPFPKAKTKKAWPKRKFQQQKSRPA